MYVYFLIGNFKLLIKDVVKCLEVIELFEDLGVGFVFVIYDLEICGVGELFGDD